MKLSTFDRNAIEEAVRLRELNGGSVTALTLGDQDSKKGLREALAIGADKAVVVLTSSSYYDSLATSSILATAMKEIGHFDLVLCSEGTSDTYQGEVGGMIAEWLGLPHLGNVRSLNLEGNLLKCEVSLENASQSIEAKLPAVVSVLSEINQPRFPTLLQVMQAGKKPIQELKIESLLRSDLKPASVDVVSVTLQTTDRKRVIFEGPPQETAVKLLDVLAAEGVLKE